MELLMGLAVDVDVCLLNTLSLFKTTNNQCFLDYSRG